MNDAKIKLHDLHTKQTSYFDSMVDVAKSLNTNAHAIMPYVKRSENNPIFERYVVTIEDLSLRLTNSNSLSKGLIHVYDMLTSDVKTYASIARAVYETGVREYPWFTKDRPVFAVVGYYFSRDRSMLPDKTLIDLEKCRMERTEYLDIPATLTASLIVLYDYYSDLEYRFLSVPLLIDYLKTLKIERVVPTEEEILDILLNAMKDKQSALLLGLGIKPSVLDVKWFPYTEEVILKSTMNRKGPSKAYEVIIGDHKEVLFGMYNVCKFLKYEIPKPVTKITIDELINACSIEGLQIRRLDQPVLKSNKGHI